MMLIEYIGGHLPMSYLVPNLKFSNLQVIRIVILFLGGKKNLKLA